MLRASTCNLLEDDITALQVVRNSPRSAGQSSVNATTSSTSNCPASTGAGGSSSNSSGSGQQLAGAMADLLLLDEELVEVDEVDRQHQHQHRFTDHAGGRVVLAAGSGVDLEYSPWQVITVKLVVARSDA